ncbi:unnamed protein product, partial [Strongylus vulgaris]
MLCTYNARAVSTNAKLHALLEAAGRINYHAIALQETKPRKTDVRQLSDGTLIIRGEKVPSTRKKKSKEVPQGPCRLSCSADNTTKRVRARTSSRKEMKSITMRFYANFFRSSTPVSNSVIPTGEIPPRILPAEVRVAIKIMKTATVPGPDHVSADLLRAGGHRLHEILA